MILQAMLHNTARSVVTRIAEQISDQTAPKAFTITGPYGGGKSSLALIISNLVGTDVKTRKHSHYF